jgi:SAM-dependent methyltransferase
MVRILAPYGGLPVFLRGLAKALYYRFLRMRHGFNPWHVNPIEWRPYALETRDYVNALVEREGLRSVLEIGCGLGEILRGIRAPEVVGFDIHDGVLPLARKMNPRAEFHLGTFADIRDRQIDVLVAIDFPHRIPPEELQGLFSQVLAANRVRYVVVDKVRYAYYHDYDRILGPGWQCVWESPVFASDHQILCYRNLADGPPGR